MGLNFMNFAKDYSVVKVICDDFQAFKIFLQLQVHAVEAVFVSGMWKRFVTGFRGLV